MLDSHGSPNSENPVERRKLFATVGILVSQQISGVQFIFSYTTTFFTLVGLDDTFVITVSQSEYPTIILRLTRYFQIIVDCIEVLGVICSFFIVGRFGRRPLLLYT